MRTSPTRPRPRPRHERRGFTLVELMMVVAIIGVLAALAIFGVSRMLSSARTAEAKNGVGAISRAATAAFERQIAASLIKPDGQSESLGSTALCETAVPVPDVIAKVAGAKYQPSSKPDEDFHNGSDATGWKCLRFELKDPITYQFSYTKGDAPVVAAGGGAAPADIANGYEAGAKGDANNDGIPSCFALHGVVVGGQLKRSTAIFTANEGSD